MAADNATLKALAEEQDVKGDEIGTVAQGVADFVAAGVAKLDAAVAELARSGMPDEDRDAIAGHLTQASTEFSNATAVLSALIAPPTPAGRERAAKKGKK